MYNSVLIRSLVEQSPMGVIVTDAFGKILLVSSSLKSSWESLKFPAFPDSCVNIDVFAMHHLNDEPYTIEELPVYRAIHYKENVKQERMKIKSVRGEWVHAQISASPVYVEGVFTYVTIICEDITDKIKVQEEVLKSQIAAKFLATMSHEVRTPIHGILGMLDVLCETSLNEEQRKHIAVVQRSTKNLLVILNDILDFEKLEADKVEFRNEIFRVRDLFTDVYTLHSSVTLTSGINMTMHIDESVPEFNFGDCQRITQCLDNIISNAVKFVAPHKDNKIDIKVTVNETNFINVSIADSGIGMTSDTLIKLFEPFTQADSSITRRYGGTGLGLSIAKRIMEKMEGDIIVDSVPGCGSTFTLKIPIKCSTTHMKRKYDASEPLSGMESPRKTSKIVTDVQQKPRILLAEDNPVNQMITTTLLTKRGY